MTPEQYTWLKNYNRAKKIAIEIKPGHCRRAANEFGKPSQFMGHKTLDGRLFVSLDPDFAEESGFERPDAIFPHPLGDRPAREFREKFSTLKE